MAGEFSEEVFGYVRDPEKKPGETPDKSFGNDLLPLLATFAEGDVDFREHCTTTDQKSLPSCVGNSTADAVEILSSLQGYPKVELSRMFVWTLARNLVDRDGDGEGDVNVNSGTFIRLAFDVLHKFGICLEADWPYDMSKWDRLPSIKAMRKATGRKIKGYYRIDETGNARIEAMIKALRAEHPIVFGTLVNEDFQRLQGENATIDTPKGATLGGHAMVCVGYSSSRGFLVKNSWGGNWGNRGFCWFTPEYMAWGNTWDIWVPTTGHNFK